MALKHTIKFILNHPLNKHQKLKALFRFVKWQMTSRLNSQAIVYPFGENSLIIVKKGMTGATGNMYSGLHEFEEMSFLLHFLKPTDTFVDVGANVGSYTILAGSERQAETITIEPIPETFEILVENVDLNYISGNVKCLNIGLGSEKGKLNFTKSLDSINRVAKMEDVDTIAVHVERFDDLIVLDKTALVKIDVEGFETEVLKGMEIALANPHLKAIIIELNGSGKDYGYDETKIHKKLVSFGFAPYAYKPFARRLLQLQTYSAPNTIYIKDYEFVNERLSTAKPFKIHGEVV